MDYAKAFRILRAAFGFSQSELASRLDIGASQLSLIEAGKRKPSHRTLESLSRVLNVPVPLITLLASDEANLAELDSSAPELSRLLLQLLVKSSRMERQGELPFRRGNEAS